MATAVVSVQPQSPHNRMASVPEPLVTRQALDAFTRRFVAHFSPEKVIMPFVGDHLAQIRQIRRTCSAGFPLDLLLWRPDEAADRYRQGDPFLREAFERGDVLHG